VLGFLVAVTVLAELADTAGVFDAAARGCARLARGSSRRLFALVAALATLTTVLLSLDTTAVLLTPVVLALAQRLGLRPLPFALLAVWLANTASLLLPVSNLTNLLALHRLGLGTHEYAAHMWLAAVATTMVTVCYLGLVFRRDLRVRFDPPPRESAADRTLFGGGVAGCACLGALGALGQQPWLAATVGAGVSLVPFLVRRREALRPRLLPWRLVLLVDGLFLVVSAAGQHGLDHLLADAAGTGTLRTAAVGAAASNVVNNLPAYLALERVVPPHHTSQLLGLLIGTNAGPLVLVWGSLATLLWRERCRARGVTVGPGQFAVLGLGGVPLLLLAGWLGLGLPH
jgi:arsenical pump membrane protein